MSQGKITVTVSGANRIGKTHLIAAIEQMLVEEGIAVTVAGIDNTPESYKEVQDRVLDNPLINLLPETFTGVEIVERYGPAHAGVSYDKSAVTMTYSVDTGEGPWNLFSAKYKVEGVPYGTHFYAKDFDHAAKVIEGLKASVELDGMVEQPPVPETKNEDQAAPLKIKVPSRHRVPIIPVISDVSKDMFVSRELFPPTDAVVVDAQPSVKTSFLAFGKKLDLLGISVIQSLIDAGVQDSTDSIDPAIGLKEIAWEVDGKPMVSLVENMVFSNFIASPSGSYMELLVDFTGVFSFDGDNTVTVKVTGSVNLEMATTALDAKVTYSSYPEEHWPKPVGYSLNVYRANPNRP